ncbi:unnamed protein product [marine sediment metagenome]|uniref:Uncharacterized protein n=1 Tax=marine sediment metagenome TaxID=412755 RepID=X0SPR4_9ZZZZ
MNKENLKALAMLCLIIFGIWGVFKLNALLQSMANPLEFPYMDSSTELYCGGTKAQVGNSKVVSFPGDREVLIYENISEETNEPIGEPVFGMSGCIWHISNIKLTNMTTTESIDTIDSNKETRFYKNNPDYVAVNVLNPKTVIKGDINAKIEGTIPVPKISGGGNMFFHSVSSYTSHEKVDLKLTGDISLLMTTELPTSYVGFEEFESRRENNLARCTEVESAEHHLFGKPVYQLFCVFETENIQFVTVIKQINIKKMGCPKTVHKNLYLFVDGITHYLDTDVVTEKDCASANVDVAIKPIGRW